MAAGHATVRGDGSVANLMRLPGRRKEKATPATPRAAERHDFHGKSAPRLTSGGPGTILRPLAPGPRSEARAQADGAGL